MKRKKPTKKPKTFKEHLLAAEVKGFRDGWNGAVETMTDNMLNKMTPPTK